MVLFLKLKLYLFIGSSLRIYVSICFNFLLPPTSGQLLDPDLNWLSHKTTEVLVPQVGVWNNLRSQSRGTTNVFHIGILSENSLCCFPDWWKRQIDCLDHHMVIAMMISSACKQSVFLLLICNLYAWLAGLEREGGRPSVGATVGLLAVPVGSGPKHSIHTSQPNCIFRDSTFYSPGTNKCPPPSF